MFLVTHCCSGFSHGLCHPAKMVTAGHPCKDRTGLGTGLFERDGVNGSMMFYVSSCFFATDICLLMLLYIINLH